MGKQWIVAAILTAVALGRASNVRAGCGGSVGDCVPPPAYVPARAPTVEEEFTKARKKITELVSDQKTLMKMEQGLKNLGFKLERAVPPATDDVYVARFCDEGCDVIIELEVNVHAFRINANVMVNANSATEFMAKTRDLELVKQTIGHIQALGLSAHTGDR